MQGPACGIMVGRIVPHYSIAARVRLHPLHPLLRNDAGGRSRGGLEGGRRPPAGGPALPLHALGEFRLGRMGAGVPTKQ